MNKFSAILIVLLFSLKSSVTCQTIDTYAGGGTNGLGDNGLAVNASLGYIEGISTDKYGNLYIADASNNRIRKVDAATGIITTVAGNGIAGSTGDGGLAINAQLNQPYFVLIDSFGNLFISEPFNNKIRKVDVNTGIITTYAGNGIASFQGDGGPATSASLKSPNDIVLDRWGNLYIDDYGSKIRKVDTNGSISTVAGDTVNGFNGDGQLAINTKFNQLTGLAIDSAGNIYVADRTNYRIRKIDHSTNVVTTIAGDGTNGITIDGVQATSTPVIATLLAFDKTWNLLFSEVGLASRVKKIDGVGIIHNIAGTGNVGFSGDGGDPNLAQLHDPIGIAFDPIGNLYIADQQNKRVRKITFPSEGLLSFEETIYISIYPNPAKEQLTITASSDVNEVVILNAIGQVLIEQENYKTNKAILNVSSLAAGVYFVKVSDKDGNVVTKRFVKE
jgi:sugar lactone lactonase YvrE